MYVELIQNNYSQELIVEKAVNICIGRPTDKKNKEGMMTAIDSGHHSVLEHIYLTYYIEGISRACSHQLIRHRLASYSQSSQRYCEIDTNKDWFVTPESLAWDIGGNMNPQNEIAYAYSDVMKYIAKAYNKLLDNNVPVEDARMILPNACKTNIIMSMNGRALVEMCSKRLCHRAQWEIRELFERMKSKLQYSYPTLYSLCLKPCETKQGCKEKYPCSHKNKT